MSENWRQNANEAFLVTFNTVCEPNDLEISGQRVEGCNRLLPPVCLAPLKKVHTARRLSCNLLISLSVCLNMAFKIGDSNYTAHRSMSISFGWSICMLITQLRHHRAAISREIFCPFSAKTSAENKHKQPQYWSPKPNVDRQDKCFGLTKTPKKNRRTAARSRTSHLTN